MTGFPQYDAATLAKLDEQTAKILGVFAARSYIRVEPPILQPADAFLDRSGEEIRRRTFVLTDPSGDELCLRPDLTVPVCRMHLAGAAKFPARLAYHGPAFRFQPNEPNRPSQFLQTGVECLGVADRASADVEVLNLAVEGVRAAGLEDFSIKLGELSLFGALVDALDIPPQWRGRLKRHFWRPDYFRELLSRLSNGAPVPAQRYLSHLATADEAEARAALSGLMDYLGSVPTGGRTREEIVERLMEQAAEAAALKLDKRAVALIERVLSVSGPAKKSIAQIRALVKKERALEEPLKLMEARIAALTKLKLDETKVSFAARFGRNMEYYTGFVFELWSEDAEGAVQVAGGGRYDNLLRALGAKRDVPAVGCAIRGERVLAAKKKRAAR
ncbi:MAG TPA: ATP phosphoribosyltransferase regulatory subunit [Micropepsaceae bacterium]|nr:ATP phosphoribosyltransferase regulatory subunit [Micropepsaceae bacterium]